MILWSFWLLCLCRFIVMTYDITWRHAWMSFDNSRSIRGSFSMILMSKNNYNENAWALTRPPATCPLSKFFCPKVVQGCQDVMPWRHMTSCRDVTWCHGVTSHDVLLLWQTLPMALFVCLCVKRFSRESAHRHTHTHTDGTDFIPSTTDAGRNDHYK